MQPHYFLSTSPFPPFSNDLVITGTAVPAQVPRGVGGLIGTRWVWVCVAVRLYWLRSKDWAYPTSPHKDKLGFILCIQTETVQTENNRVPLLTSRDSGVKNRKIAQTVIEAQNLVWWFSLRCLHKAIWKSNMAAVLQNELIPAQWSYSNSNTWSVRMTFVSVDAFFCR